jgi:choline dehydrogenase
VHIQSREVAVAPVIHANYMSHEADQRTAIAAMQMARKILDQSAMAPWVVQETRPGADRHSDEQLLEWARDSGTTSYHPIGSCRMGSDADSVVDGQLRVRGVKGLRVADCSIFPTMCSANTNAPAIAVGEKAADLILSNIC